jgi:CHASE3 domain sensor protein
MPFTKKILGTFGLATLALVVIALISYRSTTGFIAHSNLLRRSHQVLEKAEGLSTSLLYIESAVRDYALHGNPSFLDPYRAALPLVPAHLKALRRLTAANTRQQHRLDELEPLIASHLDNAQRCISATPSRDTQAPARPGGVENDKQLMDSIRRVIGAIKAEESQWLKTHNDQFTHDANFAMLVTSALDAVIVVLLIWASYATLRHLTERARIEQERARSHERLVLSQKAGRIGHFEYFFATQSCLWSAQLEALYDLAGGRFKGTFDDWLQYVHPEDRQGMKTEFERSKTSGQFDKEFRILWPNGATRWIQMRAEVSFDAAHNPVRMVGINRDVTGRKMAEVALQQSEQRHSTRNRIAEICLTTGEHDMYVRVLAVILETTGSKFGMFGYMDENGDYVVPAITPTAWEQCQMLDKSMVFPRDQWGESLWPRAIRQKQALYSNERATLAPPKATWTSSGARPCPFSTTTRSSGFSRSPTRPPTTTGTTSTS